MGDGPGGGLAGIPLCEGESPPEKRKNDQMTEIEDDFNKPGVYTRWYHMFFAALIGFVLGLFLGMYIDSFAHELDNAGYLSGIAVSLSLMGWVVKNMGREYSGWPLEMLRKTQIYAMGAILVSIVTGFFVTMFVDTTNHGYGPTPLIVYALIIFFSVTIQFSVFNEAK